MMEHKWGVVQLVVSMQRQPTEHFTLEIALSLTTWTGMITSVLAYTVEYISIVTYCNNMPGNSVFTVFSVTVWPKGFLWLIPPSPPVAPRGLGPC